MADAVRDWLFGLEAAGITLGLASIRALLAELGHPEQAFATVTVAGTNGKGSVTAMVERGLRAAGRRTGRYTSPHLTSIEERVAIDGLSIGAGAFDHAAELVREAACRLPSRPSYFEATTAVALVAFRDAAVEVAVLEVGLGGRLDATNAADATLAVITNIGLDHEAFLGNTIEAIAAEKAGVIKPGASVVVGRTSEQAMGVISSKARDIGASLIYAPNDVVAHATLSRRESWLALRTPVQDYGKLRLALPGRHQIDNAITAVRALEVAGERGIARVNASAISVALSDVRWPGRLDWRRWRDCDVLVDGAHNPDGARALAEFVSETLGARVPIVVGIMRDKAIAEVFQALASVASVFVCTAPSTTRAATPDELLEIASRVVPDVRCVTATTPLEALTRAALDGSPIVVAGSLFLAADVLGLVA
ncbi:MAG TPA: folylpolyglutamate synthase/dihydrofolate synthase family protein [Vicinamibacterales bacterium]|nr:folylpolyglutamate synthase/dihydrofolate synthase family protein [Vicinamibacterales bacterium]